VASDGSETFDRVALTLKDVLFPKTGDFIVQTNAHDNDVGYLTNVFKARLAGNKTAAVLSDCRVDWNLPGVEPLGPDVAVFLGVRRHRVWATFDVAAEGARPKMVVEVTSPDTRQNDVGDKFTFYHQAKVPLYLVVDALERGDERHLELIGYHYTRRGFRRISPDEEGRIYLKPVNLYVGVTRDRLGGYERLACFDPDTGEELGDYTALAESRAVALEQAQAAKRQAQAAKRQAQAAKRQAQAAKRQAAAKAKALAAAEARIRELEAQLKNRKKNT
jgi:Uma2 family endonuclease